MKTSRLLLLVLVVLSLVPILDTSSINQRTPQLVSDCLYLISILEKTVDYAIEHDYRGEYVAHIMLNTPVNPRIQDLHKKAYKLILSYYMVLNATKPSLEQLRGLLNEIDVIESYASKLQECSHRREVAIAVATRIKLKFISLKSQLEYLLELYSGIRELIAVNIVEKTYEPGDFIEVSVNTTCSIISASLVYKNFIIETANFTCNENGECRALLRIPPASSIYEIIEKGFRGITKFTIVIQAVCSNSELQVYRFIEAKYDYPRVTIEAPSIVTRGSFFNITVNTTSGLELTGVLIVKNNMNEYPLVNVTITSTPREYQLHADKPFFTTGRNVLKLCVNASEKTLPYCFERAIIIEPKYPSVSVRSTPTSITWTGSFPVYITSSEGEYNVYVYLNNVLVAEYRILGTGVISVNSGVLPLSVFNLTVIIRDPSGVFDDYIYSAEITCVNMLILLIVIFSGSFFTVIIRDHEKILILSLRTSSVRVARGVKREVPEILKSILKPYMSGVKSRIVELYYTLLEKLGIRFPHHYETLREHYSEVVKSTTKKSTVREILWRILRLVEEDLYSKRKPRLEEAEELYGDVLSVIEKT